jgi:diguanylate cyclase (GGDEF)-like protein/PAS domain S-box-containing protein
MAGARWNALGRRIRALLSNRSIDGAADTNLRAHRAPLTYAILLCAALLALLTACYCLLPSTGFLSRMVLLALLLAAVFFIWTVARLRQARITRAPLAHLQRAVLRMQKIIDTVFDGIIVIDSRGTIDMVNPAIEEMFGCAREELIGKNVDILMPEAHRGVHRAPMQSYLGTGARRVIGKDGELTALRRNGESFPIEIAVNAIQVDGEQQFVGVLRDISRRCNVERSLREANELLELRVAERTAELSREIEERKKCEAQLQRLASFDPLSQAYNRREFDRLFLIEFERARRYGSSLHVILFDIDYFKQVNDRHGHISGDGVIVELTALVAGAKRKVDVLARWGGDEFAMLVPAVDSKGAQALAEKLREKIAGHPFAGIGRITCSFGVASDASADTVDALLKQADRMLYRAKANGRNRVEVGC